MAQVRWKEAEQRLEARTEEREALEDCVVKERWQWAERAALHEIDRAHELQMHVNGALQVSREAFEAENIANGKKTKNSDPYL